MFFRCDPFGYPFWSNERKRTKVFDFFFYSEKKNFFPCRKGSVVYVGPEKYLFSKYCENAIFSTKITSYAFFLYENPYTHQNHFFKCVYECIIRFYKIYHEKKKFFKSYTRYWKISYFPYFEIWLASSIFN